MPARRRGARSSGVAADRFEQLERIRGDGIGSKRTLELGVGEPRQEQRSLGAKLGGGLQAFLRRGVAPELRALLDVLVAGKPRPLGLEHGEHLGFGCHRTNDSTASGRASLVGLGSAT